MATKLKLKASVYTDGRLPVGYEYAKEWGVEHPNGHKYGALLRYKRTGIYRLYSDGVFSSVPQEWAAEQADSRIKMARLQTGLTQQQLSDWLGIPKRTIENWEGKKRTQAKWEEDLLVEKIESLPKGTPIDGKKEIQFMYFRIVNSTEAEYFERQSVVVDDDYTLGQYLTDNNIPFETDTDGFYWVTFAGKRTGEVYVVMDETPAVDTTKKINPNLGKIWDFE